jgi:ABC-type uncharacterized transport system ATPase subunit
MSKIWNLQLLASHYAEDIEALCDHVSEMDQGELKATGIIKSYRINFWRNMV